MTFKPLTEIVHEAENWSRGDTPTIPLGFPFFDELTGGGVTRGQVAMLLARSGVGKTILGSHSAVTNRGLPTVFFSLEMNAFQLAIRMAGSYLNCSTRHINKELATEFTSKTLSQFAEDFPRLAIYDDGAMSLRSMGEAMEETADAWGIKPAFAIMDYMELIKAPSMSAVEGIDQVSRKLKDWSREHDCAVLILHQVNQSRMSAGGSGGSVADEGHLPLRRRDARYGGTNAADFVLAAFKPGLNPQLSDAQRKEQERDLRIQLLKTRSAGGLLPDGVRFDVDPETLQVRQADK